jgi:hypothetical protein
MKRDKEKRAGKMKNVFIIRANGTESERQKLDERICFDGLLSAFSVEQSQ